MYGELRDLWARPDARLGILGGGFVSLWIFVAYVGVPLAAGWLTRDALFLFDAAGAFFDRSVRFHVVGLVVPGFAATVAARYRSRDAAGVPGQLQIVAGIFSVPILLTWVLMTLSVLVVAAAPLLSSDPDATLLGTVGDLVLFLFGGTFLAFFVTLAVVVGVGTGVVVGYASTEAVRRANRFLAVGP